MYQTIETINAELDDLRQWYEADGADPDEWRALGQSYAEIGREAAAESCQRRAGVQ